MSLQQNTEKAIHAEPQAYSGADLKVDPKNHIKHFDYIDALRGIAILMVVMAHAGQIVFKPGIEASITSFGTHGVQLFFMVSSFTLFMSYHQRQKIDKENTDKFFFIRRIFRIAPAFYLATLFYLVISPIRDHFLLGHFAGIGWVNVLLFSLFLGVLYPPALDCLPFGGWTVEIEAFFYVFIPFLYRKVTTLNKSIIFFVATVLAYNIAAHFTDSPYLLFLSQLPYFIVGIIFFHIKKDGDAKTAKTVEAAQAVEATQKIETRPNYVGKALQFIGKISYSLYLWHFIVILFMWYVYKASNHFAGMNATLAFFVAFICTLAIGIPISYLSFKYVETKGINYGKNLIKKMSKSSRAESSNLTPAVSLVQVQVAEAAQAGQQEGGI